MFYKKELLENMSQGARLKFIRVIENLELDDVAKYMGYSSNKSIREWENNSKSPDATILKRLAEIYGVSIDAIKNMNLLIKIMLKYLIENTFASIQENIQKNIQDSC